MSFERWTASRHDLMLWIAIAGAVTVALVLIAVVIPPDPDKLEPLSRFSVPLRLDPEWDGGDGGITMNPASTERTDASRDATPGTAVYLDTSHSMGGYLPPDGGSESSVFRTTAQLVPGHLVRSFGGGVGWRTIDQSLTALASAPRFQRGLFRGSSTRLELAIREIVDDLHANRIRGAVLLTDLVATGHADGAMGAAQAILPWLRSDEVRGGRFDFGILGVRGQYWGMRAGQCPSTGSLGCWYSEHAKRYIPLAGPAERPFFVLVFGMSSTGGPASESPVDRLGKALEASLRDLELDPRWELLTRRTRTVDGRLLCTAARETEQGDRPQYALYREDDGQFECRRDDVVTLTCCATTDTPASACTGPDLLPLIPVGGSSAWSAAQFQRRGSSLGIRLDCASLRETTPAEDFDVSGRVVAEAESGRPAFWEGWSVDTDETEESLRAVLQMDLFLDAVRLRPQRYKVTADEPLLRVEGR